MKIAVCLYGQPRTALYCAPWIKEWFNVSPDTEIDYFLHTRDYNTYINTEGDPDIYDPIVVNQAQLNNIIDIYRPKKYEISNYKDERKTIANRKIQNVYSNMYYSMSSSLRLKKEYELETGELYDYCFMHRLDAIVGPTIDTFKAKLFSTGFPSLTISTLTHIFRWKKECWRLGPGDLFFGGENLATEIIMADACRIYMSIDRLVCNDDLGGPGAILGKSIHNTNILQENNSNMVAAVVRHSADLTIPVMESWQYHNDFWIKNHKSIS